MSPSEKPFALVTGASSGIGLELAKQFAGNGFDVCVCAEDAELAHAADAVRDLGAEVQVVRADLATSDGVEELVAAVGDRPVDALALNAGRGAGGAFAGGTALEDELEIIDLNCRSTVHLAKRLLPRMVERGQGRVLITSSVASTMPGSYQAVYNASKSFTQSFALGIREELKDSGVTVTSLMPGATDTEFFAKADMLDTKLGAGPKDPPSLVAGQAFAGMMNGDERVAGGSLLQQVQGKVGRFVPDSIKAKLHARMTEPGSAE